MSTFIKTDSLCDCKAHNNQKETMKWGYLNLFYFFKYREEMIKAISMKMIT